MPTSSPGDATAGTIETLGLPTRAVTALTRAGITDVAALAALTRRELAAVPGLGAGLVTAIRRVVPEPPATLPRAATPGRDDRLAPPADDDGGPDSPAIPSFASLRDPRRRTALDLLVPATGTPDAEAWTEPVPEPPTGPPPSPPGDTGRGPAGPVAPAPRPAEYADLLRLGARLARAAVTVPGRVALWSVRTQVDWLRRLLGS
ncbi:RNA polymerase, alpha chain C terminal domain [Geodermatophilus saharensis]|uniref:RNA polymerase, alpha chain C terminal domain n=1 Tax=Geodermatophilus saharensis TaxID=1137994 RepID=A0A239CUY8_9ACTN|nr:DNA-directed RNA polymerase subunit alpha C-terminal domain-containing protein [Geodermatophilus saharensis]SNS23920.1 RNA polymerase, alpha chain C terminal domain [Geodermatophilus saharensis]